MNRLTLLLLVTPLVLSCEKEVPDSEQGIVGRWKATQISLVCTHLWSDGVSSLSDLPDSTIMVFAVDSSGYFDPPLPYLYEGKKVFTWSFANIISTPDLPLRKYIYLKVVDRINSESFYYQPHPDTIDFFLEQATGGVGCYRCYRMTLVRL
ncbi:MAG: hypothetical protein A2X22_07850 [Bacteroidetes bacterium GWF2_49_14]|nr:MAG: hypothetical protein A2X22_07850 [Bacteroidetes bacterium GWF2_49_14]